METLQHRYLYLREDIHPPVRKPGQENREYRTQVLSWHRGLNPERQTLYTILREQVSGLLGVTSAEQIQPLMDNPVLRGQASERMLDQLGLVYGMRGSERIKQRFEDYGRYADSVIDFLQGYLSYQGSVNLEMVNEVRAYNDPTDLLLLASNGRWSAKARFEAKRKLLLMNLAASIERREREVGIEDQFRRFVDWLHERVWNPELLLGESRGAFLISTHDSQTWACPTLAQIIDEEVGVKLKLQPFQKKTHLPRRSFKTEAGQEMNAYVTIRDKKMEAKILKMLRKGVEDPTIAVDDDTGLLVVVDNNKNARELISNLINQGYKSNYPIIIEDVSYTLEGGEYNGNNVGSHKIRMLKFFVRLANEMRVECIIHTPETYAEQLYMRGVSHEEYELIRLFDGEVDVPRLLFPEKYFPRFDMDKAREEKQRQIRAHIEGPALTA